MLIQALKIRGRKAVEVLAAVFGGGRGKVDDIEESSKRAFIDLF